MEHWLSKFGYEVYQDNLEYNKANKIADQLIVEGFLAKLVGVTGFYDKWEVWFRLP